MGKYRIMTIGMSAIAVLVLTLVRCGDDKKSTETQLPTGTESGMVADHSAADEFDRIPAAVFAEAREDLNIFFGHTSHGSQLVMGVGLLAAENANCVEPMIREYGLDLGQLGDTNWAIETRVQLNGHPETNVVIWSWCGGCSNNTVEGINTYLATMTHLEEEYPDVAFVYMTGHLDGTGPAGNLYARNNQIRAYCEANEKILFDFADIESYDPSGTYYAEETDACGWCEEWCASHSCDECGCAHSHCFNCYRKGQAFWWLMARMSGWEG